MTQVVQGPRARVQRSVMRWTGEVWSMLGRWLGRQEASLQRRWRTASSCVSPVCVFLRKYHYTALSSSAGALALLPHLFFFYLNSWRQSAWSVLWVKFSSIRVRGDCIDQKTSNRPVMLIIICKTFVVTQNMGLKAHPFFCCVFFFSAYLFYAACFIIPASFCSWTLKSPVKNPTK